MPSFDQKSDIKPLLALNTQTIGSSTTTVGNVIDNAGYESLTFINSLGTRTDGTFTPLIEDSDDNVTYAPVADEFLIGTEAAAALTASNTIKSIGYVGTKRYVRESIVSSGVTSGSTGVSGVAIQGYPKHAPAA